MNADELGQIVDVDDDASDARLLQPVKGAVDKRAAADLDQRLRAW